MGAGIVVVFLLLRLFVSPDRSSNEGIEGIEKALLSCATASNTAVRLRGERKLARDSILCEAGREHDSCKRVQKYHEEATILMHCI